MDDRLDSLSTQLSRIVKEKKIYLSAAESCTGGMLSSSIIATPGASDYFIGGFVAYSIYMKTKVLGVMESIINKFGPVSEETAKEMSINCLEKSRSHIAIAITGLAGPGGGTKDKPVGTVCFALASRLDKIDGELEPSDIASINEVEILTECHTYKFDGDRQQINYLATEQALQLLISKIKQL